jgi:hypothetical protein
MHPIVKVVDRFRDGLHERNVYGLNIFRANQVNCEVADPSVAFLSALAEKHPSAAHVDPYFVDEDPVEEYFHPDMSHPYWPISIGLEEGQFFHGLPRASTAIIFPTATPDFLGEYAARLVSYDALALYVSASGTSEQKWNALQQLLAEVPAFEKYPPLDSGAPLEEARAISQRNQVHWIKAALQVYDLVILSKWDGSHWDVFANEKKHLSPIDDAIEQASQTIRASQWYQENAASLEWEERIDKCLMLTG